MIGNDVIDLKAARQQSNWQRKGWLEKLFTKEEQEFIRSHRDTELAVWVLWSMKEAAYKIYNRQTGYRGFNPALFVCSVCFGSTIWGNVSHNDNFYYTKTVIDNNQLYTVAVINKNDFEKIYEPTYPIIIKSDNGAPHVIAEGKAYSCSISHHGSYYKIIAKKDF